MNVSEEVGAAVEEQLRARQWSGLSYKYAMMEESGKVMSKAEVKLRKKAENLSWRSQLSSSCSGDWDANPRHTLYYKKQLSFLESEWACFTRSLGTPLPVVFRLGSNCPNILAKTV